MSDLLDVLPKNHPGYPKVLYGEGATGAVINVIPKKPFTGQVGSQLGWQCNWLGFSDFRDRWRLADGAVFDLARRDP